MSNGLNGGQYRTLGQEMGGTLLGSCEVGNTGGFDSFEPSTLSSVILPERTGFASYSIPKRTRRCDLKTSALKNSGLKELKNISIHATR